MKPVEKYQPTINFHYEQAMKQLVTVVHELSLARDLKTIMSIVRIAARELTGADGATFVLREDDQCFYAEENAISPLWKGKRFPMSACISGWVMNNRRHAVIEDIYADERIPADAYRPTFVRSLVMVPIRTTDPIGAIGNYWAKKLRPDPEVIQVLQALADTTSVAMENVRIYSELEQRIKDRTAELEATNKELQDANKELEAFSYAVSHDLRAPLRKIHSFTQILFDRYLDVVDEKGRDYMTRIRAATNRMDQLISDLLRLSRVSRSPVQKKAINLGSIAQEVASELHSSAPERSVEFIIPTEVPANGDPGLMREVMENLLANAWKFTSKRPLARIEFGSTKEWNGQIVFYVRDNGAGFDMAHAEKLFAPFERFHSEADFPGTGVGLATVQRVICNHGGRIWAESAMDSGATLYFTLS
jgi:signal transduction histidine kinase